MTKTSRYYAHVVQREDDNADGRNNRRQQQQQQRQQQQQQERVLIRVFEKTQAVNKYQSPSIDKGDYGFDHAEVDDSGCSDDIISRWITAGATLLQNQWPQSATIKRNSDDLNVGSHDDAGVGMYRRTILHHTPSRTAHYGLACSYLLLSIARKPENFMGKTSCDDNGDDGDADNDADMDHNTDSLLLASEDDQTSTRAETKVKVLGHGRLTECFESAGGNAAAATYIIIDPNLRGCGHGTCLMKMLEQEAKRLGYHYVYLWTRTAVNFYIKSLGYSLCHRVSLKRACLQSLSVHDVQGIEATLMRRRQTELNQHNSAKEVSIYKPETVMLLPPGSNAFQESQADDVWLRKRLVEHVGSILVSTDERLQEIHNFIQDKESEGSIQGHDETAGSHVIRIRWNPYIPFQPQIGPSCGLAALRMVRDYYNSNAIMMTTESQVKQTPINATGTTHTIDRFPSLLSEAISRGYTNDGEIFDATNLYRLAVDVCDIPPDNAEIVNTLGTCAPSSKSASSFLSRLDACIRQGGVAIIPYDSNPRTRSPTNFNGTHAHWGIIVGIIYFQFSTDREMKTHKPVVILSKDEDIVPYSSSMVDGGNLPGENFWECYLCVQHSLSERWAIAPFDDWIASNAQLDSIDKTKFYVDEKGLNLKNKIMLIHKK